MLNRAAIILAGGKGKRFQTSEDKWKDKALAVLNDKPLLVHAIENIKDSVEEIIVAVEKNEGRIKQYQNILEKFHVQDVRIATDINVMNLSGPLIAILTGLKSTRADYCITIPADVPFLNRKVAEYMFDEINDSYVAVPMWPNGRLETLLMVLNRKITLQIAYVLCQLGRTHPDDIIRGVQKTLFVSPLGKIKTFDPELCSFININKPEDLKRLQPRREKGAFAEDVRLNLGVLPTKDIQSLSRAFLKRIDNDFLGATEIFSCSAIELENKDKYFWAAVAWENAAKSFLDLVGKNNDLKFIEEAEAAFLKASQNYGSEAEVYLYNRCFLLAERAKADKAWCESQIKKLIVK
jgi:molybdopterin-guanine dinucleotide biosynthesis protein A